MQTLPTVQNPQFKNRHGVICSNIHPIQRFKGVNEGEKKNLPRIFQSECLSMTNIDRRAENKAL